MQNQETTGTSRSSSSKPIVTVIAEARHSSPDPQTHVRDPFAIEQSSLWDMSKHTEDPPPSSESSRSRFHGERAFDQAESSGFLAGHSPGAAQRGFPALAESYGSDLSEETIKGGPAYPPFPCPFCDRAYTSWGFRRRHIKAVHTISPSLNCKWCLQVLPTHAAWRRHVISAHNLSASDAHNGLLILEEAHMVLQIARPTRLDTLVNFIKQSSQQNNSHETAQPDQD